MFSWKLLHKKSVSNNHHFTNCKVQKQYSFNKLNAFAQCFCIFYLFLLFVIECKVPALATKIPRKTNKPMKRNSEMENLRPSFLTVLAFYDKKKYSAAKTRITAREKRTRLLRWSTDQTTTVTTRKYYYS